MQDDGSAKEQCCEPAVDGQQRNSIRISSDLDAPLDRSEQADPRSHPLYSTRSFRSRGRSRGRTAKRVRVYQLQDVHDEMELSETHRVAHNQNRVRERFVPRAQVSFRRSDRPELASTTSANCPNPSNPLGSLGSSQGTRVTCEELGYLVRNRGTL